MNSTVSPSCHFGSLAAVWQTWSEYVDCRKRQNTYFCIAALLLHQHADVTYHLVVMPLEFGCQIACQIGGQKCCIYISSPSFCGIIIS